MTLGAAWSAEAGFGKPTHPRVLRVIDEKASFESMSSSLSMTSGRPIEEVSCKGNDVPTLELILSAMPNHALPLLSPFETYPTLTYISPPTLLSSLFPMAIRGNRPLIDLPVALILHRPPPIPGPGTCPFSHLQKRRLVTLRLQPICNQQRLPLQRRHGLRSLTTPRKQS